MILEKGEGTTDAGMIAVGRSEFHRAPRPGSPELRLLTL